MSSKDRNVQVKMVRVKRTEGSLLNRYDDRVTVGMPIDPETRIVYLRIAVKDRAIITTQLDKFQWLEESSGDGVTTLESPSMQIIIIYDANDRRACDFFDEMKDHLLPNEAEGSSTPNDSMDKAINDLMQSIRDGSSKKAGQTAEYLARGRSKVQFKLHERNDNDDDRDDRKREKSAAAAAPEEVLELKLQVESHLNRPPILQTIYVNSGTKLRDLKEQIENETDIKKKDQIWFFHEQYIIDDAYEFGSDTPVLPPRPVNAPRLQPHTPKDPIRSGDTLIMCIAQVPPYR